ncbi:MAG TPA: metallophosphoesterase [Acidobacteriota bacterium]|nr:metallophosphoesterase [Acidobacteriota bacterium]
MGCFFVSDLHGDTERYQKLFAAVTDELPAAVFLGGDLLPSAAARVAAAGSSDHDFVTAFLVPGFAETRRICGSKYPRVFLILGNDDRRDEETAIVRGESGGLWEYVHERCVPFSSFRVCGYACVPPTPFHLKDWERYDVSRHVDPGSVSPERGWRTTPVSEREIRYSTIQQDLDRLAGKQDLTSGIMLFHAPPYNTGLDRAGLDGRMVDGVPLDVHVGSIAVRRFIESRQPLLTLHGHIHESPRLTGAWRERIGRTFLFSAAHDGSELALVRFDPAGPETASRELL